MDFVDQLKGQVDIVRTVGEYVRLRRMGARYVGLCPFHTEKTPSFNVNPGIQIYKCFGCGVAGDVIKFVQEVEGLTFWEALKSLAERNGIPIPQRRDHSDAETDLRAAVFEMYDLAAKAYQEALGQPHAEEVRAYLKKRGLNSSVAQQFGLGYSETGWENLVRRFGKRFTPEQMHKSGLFGRREEGSFYDKFRGRLMFPIHNESGKVIGFGGRALRADDEPKYLNSPETPIYKKSNVLYNLHRAKETIRKDDRTVLVEGYMDVIGVYAAGVRNVVASCGTALTSGQVRSMKRHSESIVVNFDPDAAGQSATERSIQMLLDEGMHVRVLELEAGLDPDEYIKRYGPDDYQARLAKAANYFIWLADRARKQFDMSTAEGRMRGYEAMLQPALRHISDRLERASIATEVAAYLGLDREFVMAEFKRVTPQRPQSKAPAQEPALPQQEAVLLRTLVSNGDAREVLVQGLRESIAARSFRSWPILERLFELFEGEPGFGFEALQARLDDPQRRVLSQTVIAGESDETMTVEQSQTYLGLLRSQEAAAQSDLKSRIAAAERAGDLQEAMRLMELASRPASRRQIRKSSA
jgi:DNA primase